jgi:hypothetical protein
VYQKAWLDRFDELWTFNNHAAGANHAHVVLHQHLSDQQAAIIRDCGAPIACQVGAVVVLRELHVLNFTVGPWGC